MSETLPATVLVPTIGRPRLLHSCLRSLGECEPGAAEVIVLDQSDTETITGIVKDVGVPRVRHVRLGTRGKGRAINAGLRLASFDVVFVTDDDCVVANDWIATGVALLADDPDSLFTGRVIASEDPAATPSTIDAEEPAVYQSSIDAGRLYGGNMVCHRSRVLEIGGFDDVIAGSSSQAASEDNEFSYRWLRLGRKLRYEPGLLVWHRHWRTPEQLRTLYVGYARAQGMFYGKHLRMGDWTMLRFLARDLYAGARGLTRSIVYRRRDPSDWRLGVFRGLPAGVVAGWRAYSGRSPRRARTPTRRS